MLHSCFQGNNFEMKAILELEKHYFLHIDSFLKGCLLPRLAISPQSSSSIHQITQVKQQSKSERFFFFYYFL